MQSLKGTQLCCKTKNNYIYIDEIEQNGGKLFLYGECEENQIDLFRQNI